MQNMMSSNMDMAKFRYGHAHSHSRAPIQVSDCSSTGTGSASASQSGASIGLGMGAATAASGFSKMMMPGSPFLQSTKLSQPPLGISGGISSGMVSGGATATSAQLDMLDAFASGSQASGVGAPLGAPRGGSLRSTLGAVQTTPASSMFGDSHGHFIDQPKLFDTLTASPQYSRGIQGDADQALLSPFLVRKSDPLRLSDTLKQLQFLEDELRQQQNQLQQRRDQEEQIAKLLQLQAQPSHASCIGSATGSASANAAGSSSAAPGFGGWTLEPTPINGAKADFAADNHRADASHSGMAAALAAAAVTGAPSSSMNLPSANDMMMMSAIASTQGCSFGGLADATSRASAAKPAPAAGSAMGGAGAGCFDIFPNQSDIWAACNGAGGVPNSPAPAKTTKEFLLSALEDCENTLQTIDSSLTGLGGAAAKQRGAEDLTGFARQNQLLQSSLSANAGAPTSWLSNVISPGSQAFQDAKFPVGGANHNAVAGIAGVLRGSLDGACAKKKTKRTSTTETSTTPNGKTCTLSYGPTQSEQWNEKYQELVAFRRRFGHCHVPNSNSDGDKPLAHWVRRQRHQYRRKVEGKHSTLSDDRQRALEELDFVWDSHAAIWEERFQELVHFHCKYGHCKVPRRYPPNPQLAIWVKCQRRQFQLNKCGERTALSTERTKRLEDLGFVWYARGNRGHLIQPESSRRARVSPPSSFRSSHAAAAKRQASANMNGNTNGNGSGHAMNINVNMNMSMNGAPSGSFARGANMMNAI